MGEPVFVCGLGRCGTTWIARSLAQSPALAYVGEAWLLGKLDELVRWHGTLHDEWGAFTTWRGQGIGRAAFVRSVARFYDQLLSEAAGGRRYLEKTPEWNVVYLPLLAELFPDALYILIYRDGRNYVSSLEARQRRDGQEVDFEGSCRRWSSGMEIFAAARDAGVPRNARFVRYEDLLERFDEIFAELCEFVGVAPMAVDPFPPNSAFPNHHRAEDFNTRWYHWSKRQKAVFRRHAGEQLALWGYADQSEPGWLA